MTISEKSIKLLWAKAAGRCSFKDCNEVLCYSDDLSIAPYTIGEMAHIKGKRPGSNRYDKYQINQDRDSYSNLILLCPNHHTIIDKPENERYFSVEKLLHIKQAHENYIDSLLNSPKFENLRTAATHIASLLTENHQSWLMYGPKSELSRRNSQNESAHQIWLTERLSTILPNNTRILRILDSHKSLFFHSDTALVSTFRLHALSYQKWVLDDIEYSAVLPFPSEFDDLIRRLSDDGIS